MKKTLLIMVMALALLLTQCRKPEVKFPSPVAPEGTTVSMTVTAGPGGKTDITPAGGITWSSGDRLYVGHNDAYVGYLTLVSGSGTPTGTFSGDVTLTGITEGAEQTFHFFYLGSVDYTGSLTKGESATVDVDFSSQEIYADVNNKLVNASAQHVGYGTAKGTVSGGVVTGINVTLVSKVALARFSFKKNSTDYTGALTLSGTNIYKDMTVNFSGTFTGKTTGNIALGSGNAERYVMLVPTGATETQTLTFTGSAEDGTGDVPGLQSNKFYGKTEPIAVTLTASAPAHEYVDLGLSVKWATCNLGASKPEEYGDYYAWGETAPYIKNDVWCEHPSHNDDINFDAEVGYKWKNYLDGNSTEWDASLDWKPYDATSKVLTSEHDAATKAWGDGWRMPTTEEWKALYDNTTNAWTGDYNGTGVAGLVFTRRDGKGTALFLPAAGSRDGKRLKSAGSYGYYWSSSLNSSDPYYAYRMDFKSGSVNPQDGLYRYIGYSVRPVRGGATPEPPATPKFSVGSGTTVEFSPGNLYWDGSAFRFESNQWDTKPAYSETDEGSGTWDASHVSHFKWSAAANAVTGDENYSGDLFCASDFTVAGDSHTWRTLSEEEWDYLLYDRADAEDLRDWVTLSDVGVSGLVLLPDGSTVAASDITTSEDLASHGAVFLPAAGGRDGTGVLNVGSGGYYCSSTSTGSDSAYYMYFDSGEVSAYDSNRIYGYSVRLVW